MSEDEIVAELDALTNGDTEAVHARADELLLEAASPAVAAAWHRAEDRCGGFWYA